LSQFHKSKIVLKIRTLSKGGNPVDLHYKSFRWGEPFTRKPRQPVRISKSEWLDAYHFIVRVFLHKILNYEIDSVTCEYLNIDIIKKRILVYFTR